ncbi:MAG: glycosyltransferase family protein [Burkholderiales bacterium]|nr:glycosyltransferase family protein [Burkholderiales bacterium]
MAEGVDHYREGDFRRAAACFEQCVAHAHDDAEALLNLGLSRQRLGEREEAADAFALALAFRPDCAEAHFNLGVLELEAGAFESAAARFEEAARLRPGYAEALSNLGLVRFRHLARFDAAEAALGEALAARPGFPGALCNLGMLRQDQGRFEEALALYDEVLRADPGVDEARLNRGLIHLAHGRYAQGWEDYEARKRGSTHFFRRFERYPEWDGRPVPGRTLLVYGEQGLGDEIMFASCVREAMAMAGRCVIDCSPKLAALFGRSFPGAIVHGGPQSEADLAWLERVPAIDLRVPSGSLPRWFRRSAAAFPRHAGYLAADPPKLERWRARLGALGPGLKVGLSWRGGTARTRRDTRSIALAALAPVLGVGGARFVSLQYTDCREEIAALEASHRLGVAHWPDAIADYDETAALVAALDLVISVQTAIVHLAGALGRRAWVLVPAVPEWRYGASGAGMPWYPAVELFRQSAKEDWGRAIGALAGRLTMLAECDFRTPDE